MGCYGALNALKLLTNIRAQSDAKVLVVCIELCTLHFQKETLWTTGLQIRCFQMARPLLLLKI